MQSLPPLDFTPLIQAGKNCIVRPDTQEHAQHFVDEMWRQFPQNAFGSGYKGSYWGRYSDLVYNVNLSESRYPDTMTVGCYDDYPQDPNHYLFFEYADLVRNEELGEFSTDDFAALLL